MAVMSLWAYILKKLPLIYMGPLPLPNPLPCCHDKVRRTAFCFKEWLALTRFHYVNGCYHGEYGHD